jgi:hypothetical protein
MLHPNKAQWVIIWAAVLIAAHIWMGLRVSDFWPGNNSGGWGLPNYLNRARYYNGPPKLAVTVLVVGGLLAWMASKRRKA